MYIFSASIIANRKFNALNRTKMREEKIDNLQVRKHGRKRSEQMES